jgi:hypothetical protein
MVRSSLQRLRDLLRILSESQEAVKVREKVTSGMDVAQPELFQQLLDFFGILQDLRAERVILRDLNAGLVDFPARHRGKEIFLCWKEGEPRVEHWHGKGSGFRGRRHISDLP